MPTKREREYYAMGFRDGLEDARRDIGRDFGRRRSDMYSGPTERTDYSKAIYTGKVRSKRRLSSWQKFIKANSKKRKFKYRDGKLNLKKMGIAYRKTREYKKNQKKRR
jgi:hypothetical protein